MNEIMNIIAELARANGGPIAVASVLGVGVYSERHKVLFWAAKQGHNKLVRALLAIGVDVNVKDEDSQKTALMCAAELGHHHVVQSLLEKDADGALKHKTDVNAQDNRLDTALILAAKSRHLNIVQSLLDVAEIDVNAVNRDDETALICAVFSGHADVVKHLLEHVNIDVIKCDDSGRTPLMLAVERGHADVVKHLLEKDEGGELKHKSISVNDRINYDNRYAEDTPLTLAIKEGTQGVIECLLDVPGIDVNRPNRSGSTPLMCAAEFGRADVVSHLLQTDGDRQLIHKTEINRQNDKEETALMLAMKTMNVDAVERLLAVPDILVDLCNKDGDTALMVALKQDKSDEEEIVRCVTAFLDSIERSNPRIQCNINQLNKKSNNALIIAIQKRSRPVVERLLAFPWINVNQYEGTRIPLVIAYDNDRGDCGPFMALVGAKAINLQVSLSHQKTVCKTIKDCRFSVWGEDIEKELNVFLFAAFQGDVPVLNNLLRTDSRHVVRQKALYRVTDTMEDGLTALYYAVRMKHGAAVKLLLDFATTDEVIKMSSQVDKMLFKGDSQACSLLDYAVLTGHAGIFHQLLTAYPEDSREIFCQPILLQCDQHDDTRLHHLANYLDYGSTELASCAAYIMAALLPYASKEQINAQNQFGHTPLDSAVVSNHPQIVQQLLKKNISGELSYEVDVNKQDKGGSTALSLALQLGRAEIAIALLSVPGIHIKKEDFEQFHRIKGRSLVSYLIGKMPHYNIIAPLNSGSASFLSGLKQTLETLLAVTDSATGEYIFTLHDQDDSGKTPLHYAAIRGYLDENGQPAIVDFLCKQHQGDAGAFMNAKDYQYDVGVKKDHKTALMYAAEYGRTDTVNYLVRHGSDINTIDAMGQTALMLAVQKGHTAVVTLLRDRGAFERAVHSQSITGRRSAAERPRLISPHDDSCAVSQKSPAVAHAQGRKK
jgi:ankyrin repeat protein